MKRLNYVELTHPPSRETNLGNCYGHFNKFQMLGTTSTVNGSNESPTHAGSRALVRWRDATVFHDVLANISLCNAHNAASRSSSVNGRFGNLPRALGFLSGPSARKLINAVRSTRRAERLLVNCRFIDFRIYFFNVCPGVP